MHLRPFGISVCVCKAEQLRPQRQRMAWFALASSCLSPPWRPRESRECAFASRVLCSALFLLCMMLCMKYFITVVHFYIVKGKPFLSPGFLMSCNNPIFLCITNALVFILLECSSPLIRVAECHTRFKKDNRMHLICALGSSFTHTIEL